MTTVVLDEALLSHQRTCGESDGMTLGLEEAKAVSRPTSAWKNSQRKPNFKSLDNDYLDLEILELDDDDDDDSSEELNSSEEVAQKTTLTANHNADEMSASSCSSLSRSDGAWQKQSNCDEFQMRRRFPANGRKSTDAANASESEANSSTDMTGSGRGSEKSTFNRSRVLERNSAFRNRSVGRRNPSANGKMAEVLRTGYPFDDYNRISFLSFAKVNDVMHRVKPSVAMETNRLTYSNMRQKLESIEKLTNATVKRQVPEILNRRKHRLRPLMTRKARRLIHGLGLDGHFPVRTAPPVASGDTAHSVFPRVVMATPLTAPFAFSGEGKEDRRPTRGRIIRRRRLSAEQSPFATPSVKEKDTSSFHTNQLSRESRGTPGTTFIAKTDDAQTPKTTTTTATTAITTTTGTTITFAKTESNVSESVIDEVRNSRIDQNASSVRGNINSRVDIRPKYVTGDLFESSTSVTRSCNSDMTSPLVSSRSANSGRNYVTDYSQFRPNDVNLEEFSLFGEFTKSLRPTSPEPSDEVLESVSQPATPSSLSLLAQPPTSAAAASNSTSVSRDDRCVATSPSIDLSLSIRDESSSDDDVSPRLRHPRNPLSSDQSEATQSRHHELRDAAGQLMTEEPMSSRMKALSSESGTEPLTFSGRPRSSMATSVDDLHSSFGLSGGEQPVTPSVNAVLAPSSLAVTMPMDDKQKLVFSESSSKISSKLTSRALTTDKRNPPSPAPTLATPFSTRVRMAPSEPSLPTPPPTSSSSSSSAPMPPYWTTESPSFVPRPPSQPQNTPRIVTMMTSSPAETVTHRLVPSSTEQVTAVGTTTTTSGNQSKMMSTTPGIALTMMTTTTTSLGRSTTRTTTTTVPPAGSLMMPQPPFGGPSTSRLKPTSTFAISKTHRIILPTTSSSSSSLALNTGSSSPFASSSGPGQILTPPTENSQTPRMAPTASGPIVTPTPPPPPPPPNTKTETMKTLGTSQEHVVETTLPPKYHQQ